MTGVRRVGVLIAVGCLLTACGSDDVADSPPSPPTSEAPAPTSSAETPTPTPSPTPPALPAEAAAATASGASAFGRWWWEELVPYAYATGDVEQLEQLAGPECLLCESLVGDIKPMWDTGGSFRGGEITVTSAESPGLQTNDIAIVTVYVDRAAGEQLDDEGVVVSKLTGEGELRTDLYLAREGESWKMEDATTGDPFASPSPSS